MSHKDDALRDLHDSGVLDALRWAVRSASARTLTDYSEAAGHDAQWLGTTRYVLLKDRLDRVFSCGKYYVPEGSDAATGLDVVQAELTPEDIDTMPIIPPGLVKRANIHGSPGWSTGNHHFLIQSFPPGDIDVIRWEYLSETKQQVARQTNPNEPALFDLPPSMQPVPVIDVGSGTSVLVAAHSLNPVNGAAELYLGLPSVDAEHCPWHWRQSLHDQRPSGGRLQIAQRNQPSNPNDIPDTPVRLRNRNASGEGSEERRA